MASPDTVAQPTVDRRAERYKAQRVQWAESSLDRVRACGHHAVSDTGVGIRHTSDSAGNRSAGFAGLSTCGSWSACAVCSHKIAMERSAEVAEAIRRWEFSSPTRYVAMVTLTMRHYLGQRLDMLWDSLSHAWSKTTSGRGWKDIQSVYGSVDLRGKGNRVPWIRFVESTVGENGWHLHIHSLLFLDAAREVADSERSQEKVIGASMFARWAAALVRKGLDSPEAHLGGLDVKRLNRGSEDIAAYLAKQTYDHAASAEAAAGRYADRRRSGEAFEVASGATKQGKRGGRTPFQLLLSVVDSGDADDLDLWHEWEAGARGRRQVGWALGFREWLALEAERTDEEIAAEELDGETLAWVDPDDWARLRLHKAEILRAAETLPLSFLRSAPARIWLTEYRHRLQLGLIAAA